MSSIAFSAIWASVAATATIASRTDRRLGSPAHTNARTGQDLVLPKPERVGSSHLLVYRSVQRVVGLLASARRRAARGASTAARLRAERIPAAVVRLRQQP